MATKKQKQLDFASSATLLLTVFFFALALVEKGLTHDMLLEAGVFLVSAKLVLSSYKSSLAMAEIHAKLDQLLSEKTQPQILP